MHGTYYSGTKLELTHLFDIDTFLFITCLCFLQSSKNLSTILRHHSVFIFIFLIVKPKDSHVVGINVGKKCIYCDEF